MARWWTTPEADESVLQFRERSIRDGSWLTYAVGVVVAGYALASWEQPHRSTILVLLAVAALAAAARSARVPAAAIVRTRWREEFFLGWTAADGSC